MSLAPPEVVEAIRASGLVRPGSRVVVMVSGGADSSCLAAGLAEFLGPDNLDAIHLNYRLRTDSDQDEAICRDLCGRLRVALRVERPTLPRGNVQAAAREARYSAAERLRAQFGADWIATGHTRTDLAETFLYRLATSPGSRALLGLAPRRGRIIRPLLSLGRERMRELADSVGLPYKDDPSNLDPRFARVRVRTEVLPVLRALNPEAERNLASTWREIAEESEALEQIALAALQGAEPAAAPVASLAGLHPAVRRIALRLLAERAAGRSVALGLERADHVWAIAQRPQGGVVELPGGVRAVCESGWVVFAADPLPGTAFGPGASARAVPGRVAPAAASPVLAPPSEPRLASWPSVALPVPGGCRWGSWQIQTEVQPGRPARPAGPDIATLDADALGDLLTVRGWVDGDRISPLGLEGSKSLQDLFTDRGVPRSHRRLLPVVAVGDEIAWVAGLAIGERFKINSATRHTAVITATPIRG